MMKNRKKHWLVAAEIILAAGVMGDASAQAPYHRRPHNYSYAQESVVEIPTSEICAPQAAPRPSWWSRWKGKIERHCVNQAPDPYPLGQSVYQTYLNHIDQGIAGRMILNDFDFEMGSPTLNQRGRDKLMHLAGLAMKYPYSIIVERTLYDPALAKVRVEQARIELANLSVPVSPDRIVEGAAPTVGLSGMEAFIIYGNLLQQTQSQGIVGGDAGQGNGILGGIGIPGGSSIIGPGPR